MPMTNDEIRALRDGCECVTPGPWRPDPWDGNEGNVCANDVYVAQCVFGKDIDHIARCDPSTIAELATRLLAAEARVKEMDRFLDDWERRGYQRAIADASHLLFEESKHYTGKDEGAILARIGAQILALTDPNGAALQEQSK